MQDGECLQYLQQQPWRSGARRGLYVQVDPEVSYVTLGTVLSFSGTLIVICKMSVIAAPTLLL